MLAIHVEAKRLPQPLQIAVKRLSRKLKVSVAVQDGPVTTFGTWWDGGSRAEYWRVNLATGETFKVNPGNVGPFSGGTGVEIPPEAGWAVLEGGTFCGKPATPRLILSSFGDETLGHLQAAWAEGECPWPVVQDRMEEVGLNSGR